LDYLTGETHVCVVSWPSMARRMERLYGKPFDTRGQVQRWKVEGLTVAFRKPRKTAAITPAGRLNRGFSKRSPSGEGATRDGQDRYPQTA
jgi:hypothetical protein